MKSYSLLDEAGKLLEIIPETVDVEVPVLDEEGQPTGASDTRKVPLKERYHPDFIAKLVPYRVAHSQPPAPAPVPVPTVVTMRQARLALIEKDHYKTVQFLVQSSDDDRVRVEWEFAATVERASPTLAALAKGLNLDSAALDELFILAATL